MLLHPLLDQLQQLKCEGMLAALKTQLQQPEIASLSFEERLSLLLEQECLLRENRKLQTRLRQAKLKSQACVPDIDYQASRGLAKSVMLRLTTCDWIKHKQNLLITGPTGTGKTYLACALAHQACLQGFSARYCRLPRLFQELALAKGDGSYASLMKSLAKTQLLILDDWGLATLTEEQRRDLLEIMDDRHNLSSTLVTSQIPLNLWHEVIADPTLGDAILDRLVHNAHKLELTGESLRKQQQNHLLKED
jgi:DNA replication protein DnaC